MSQCDIQEDIPYRSFKADHQRLGVFAAFRAMFGSVEYGGMYAKMKSLVV